MRAPAPEESRSPRKKRGGEPAAVPEPQDRWLDKAAGFWLRLDRFSSDLAGVGLLLLALLTLLGLVGFTHGVVIDFWTGLLRRWLGWGAFLVILAAGFGGVLLLWRGDPPLRRLSLGRVLSLEGLVFTLLALAALVGGRSLERADMGLDGGLVGWGLAELARLALPGPLDAVVLVLLALVFAAHALGGLAWLSRRIESWLAQDAPEEFLAAEEPAQAAPTLEPVPDAPDKPQRGKRGGPKPVMVKPVARVERSPNLPPLDLLIPDQDSRPDEGQIHHSAQLIEQTLAEFGIPARVVGFRVGPTVTQYAVEPGFVDKIGPDGAPQRQKVRVSQISGLAKDLALRLSAERLRIEAPVPGQSFVGVEVPNAHSAMVRLRSLLETPAMQRMTAPLALALGRDVSGQPVLADLSRMPHMLVAGTTGSGKSVCIAAIATCLVMNNSPEQLRLAMLDPKMVELIRFKGLPHLLGSVETETERMLGVLRWALQEMDARYRLLEANRVRDLEGYNQRALRHKEPTLPRIVILIDELADLMMSAPEQTEGAIVRLAQLARAVGIHLVVATQRPSTDVVTGLIKANFPARIAFTVASAVDSRVILDVNGAETLLGHGDMLFLNPEVGTPTRAQGVILTDAEMDQVIAFWQRSIPPSEEAAPWEELLQEAEEEGGDALVKQAIEVIRRSQHASTSMLQRRLRIGYPRAARLMEELEALGVVGPAQPGGREREVLMSPDDEIDLDGSARNGYDDEDED